MPDEKSDSESMPESENPFVSVIIPVYNDAEYLRKCLNSLQRQTYPADRVEIIVVDNGSDEKLSQDLIDEFERTIFLEEPTPGSYAARNKAISQARGEVFAFIDSDIVAAPDWLISGIHVLNSHPDIGAVGGRVDFSFRDGQNPSAVELYDSLTSFKQKDYVEKDHFSGAGNLFTTPDVFEKVGLFNKNLKSGGDREWGNRVYNAGYLIAYAEDAVVYHPARNSMEEMLRKHRRVAGGNAQKIIGGKKMWSKFLRAQIVEVLIFLRLCKETVFDGKVPVVKMVPVLAINMIVSMLRILEPYRILLGGKPIR
ncbi:glycosyltransferase [Thermodesulfobacteriota bacterium]